MIKLCCLEDYVNAGVIIEKEFAWHLIAEEELKMSSNEMIGVNNIDKMEWHTVGMVMALDSNRSDG